MNADSYYPMVTEAIRRAEILEDLKAPGASAAYLDVSLLEEKISESLPASDPEGAIARRGAVRAALSARDFVRAQQLTERFLAEDAVDAELREELLQLSQEPSSSAGLPDADDELRIQVEWRAAKQSKDYLLHSALILQLVGVGILLIRGLGHLFGELSQPLSVVLLILTYGPVIMASVMLVAFFYTERRLDEDHERRLHELYRHKAGFSLWQELSLYNALYFREPMVDKPSEKGEEDQAEEGRLRSPG